MPSSISTALERNISSCVPAETVAMVVVLCAGKSTTLILTVATPITGILVLFVAQSLRLDGDKCLLSHPMSLHTDSLMMQLNAPVSANASTVTVRGRVVLVLPWSARFTLTLILGTDFMSLVLDTWNTNPSY